MFFILYQEGKNLKKTPEKLETIHKNLTGAIYDFDEQKENLNATTYFL